MAEHSWRARTTLGRILAIESAKERSSGLLMCDASSSETILVVEDDVAFSTNCNFATYVITDKVAANGQLDHPRPIPTTTRLARSPISRA